MPSTLNVNHAKKFLKDSGFRQTKQRDMILELLEGNKNHPTADDIIEIIKSKAGHVTVATVYNTLETLSKQGLIKKLDSLDTKSHFDPDTKPHYHAICTKYKKVFDLVAPPNVNIQLPSNFSMNDCYIHGCCDNCKKN